MSALALASPFECAECGQEIAATEGGVCATCRAYARSEAKDQLTPRTTPAELVAVYRQAERRW